MLSCERDDEVRNGRRIVGVLGALEVLTGWTSASCPLPDPSIASIWVTYANGSRGKPTATLFAGMCIFSPLIVFSQQSDSAERTRLLSLQIPDEAAKFFFPLAKVSLPYETRAPCSPLKYLMLFWSHHRNKLPPLPLFHHDIPTKISTMPPANARKKYQHPLITKQAIFAPGRR